jgi:hypothetical protein
MTTPLGLPSLPTTGLLSDACQRAKPQPGSTGQVAVLHTAARQPGAGAAESINRLLLLYYFNNTWAG